MAPERIWEYADIIAKDLLASYDVTGQITAIEEMIAQGADMQIVLRLLCLASITAGGIKAKSLENMKREVLQVYTVYIYTTYSEFTGA
jgi:DNA-binding FrmR family transcriptional regulator